MPNLFTFIKENNNEVHTRDQTLFSINIEQIKTTF